MKFRFIYTFFALLFFAFLFLSSSGGRNDARANAPGDSGFCSSCHSGGAEDGGIVLTGAPTSYEVGTTYSLTLTLTNSAAVEGGFQIVATNGITNSQVGTFSTPAGTRLNPLNRLVHSAPQSFMGTTSTAWTFDWTAPSSGAPANVQFYFAGNAVNGLNNTGGDFASAGTSASIVLPVELSQFDVESNSKNQVSVTWQTQSEQNSQHFEIQRSIPTDDDVFKTIGQVDAAGDATRTIDYEYVDESPLWNQYVYYRLKQVDIDGAFSFSPIQSLKMNRDEEFSIYPNPIRKGEILNIQTKSNLFENERVRIFDVNGRVVSEAQKTTSGGDLSLDISKLSAGLYFVSIYNKNERGETKKLVVQN